MARCWLAAVATLIVAATATADPAAEAVRDHVRKAVGYDAFRKLEHGVELEGKAEYDGLPGTFRMRLHPDGRYAAVIDTKAGFATGFDGKARWSLRCTTPALPVELRYAEIYRFQYALVGHRWLAPDAGYTVATDPREHRPYRPCLAVRHPDSRGVTARVYVDPTTWLPDRLTTLVGTGESVIEVSDWRDVGGAKVPGRVAFGRYAGGSELVAATAVAAPAPAGADPFATPPPPADTTFDPALPPAVETRLAKGAGLLLVRPAVSGRPGPWMLLNTGVTTSMMTPAEADRLGLPAVGRLQINGGIKTRFRTADRLALGSAVLSGRVFTEAPADVFAEMGRVLGTELGGMLGTDVLARVVLEADFAAGRVAVHDPRAYRPPPQVAWDAVRFDDGIPYLTGTFEGKHTGLFRFESGTSVPVVFNDGAVRGLGLLAGRRVEPSAVLELAGPGEVYELSGSDFRVLGYTARPISARFANEPNGNVAYPYCLGAFGPAVLGPGTVVFDYPNRRIGFAPKS